MWGRLNGKVCMPFAGAVYVSRFAKMKKTKQQANPGRPSEILMNFARPAEAKP